MVYEMPLGGGIHRISSFLLLIDPSFGGAPPLALRVSDLTAAMREAGVPRLPGERRHARRAEVARSGIPLARAEVERLKALIAT